MKLQIVRNSEPPEVPKGNRIGAKGRAIIALLIIGAIAGGIWWLSHWFSEPVSGAYLREQSASFNKCEREELSYKLGPITRYTLWLNHSVCDYAERETKTIKDQRDALRNLR